MDAPATRSALLATYERRYGRWTLRALRVAHAHVGAAVTVLLAAGAAIGALAGWDGAGTLLTLAIVAAVMTALVALQAAIAVVRAIRSHTAEWREGDGELARVRAARPHAGEADPVVAHDEYAVGVSDHGTLVTFAFTPLRSSEDPDPAAILLPGFPRHEAREVITTVFEPVDAERASEQLVEAQAHAAGLEQAAILRARDELEDDTAARELMLESRSTGAALRSITGQAE